MSDAPEKSTVAEVPVLTAEQQIIRQLQQQLAELQKSQHHSTFALRLKEPECFHGRQKENVDRWIFLVEQYFLAAKETDDASRVAFAGALLRDNAAAWWEYLVHTEERAGHREEGCTWATFKDLLQTQFRSVNREQRARDRLASLVQRKSVADYLTTFLRHTFDIPDLSESEKIDRFFRGLKPDVQKWMIMKGRPTSFAELVRVAENIDSTLFTANKTNRGSNWVQQTARNDPQPMELGAITQKEQSIPKEKKKKLTAEEREELRKAGKCFYCREQGHLAINCPKKANRQ